MNIIQTLWLTFALNQIMFVFWFFALPKVQKWLIDNKKFKETVLSDAAHIYKAVLERKEPRID